jgi:hypothetical protein
MSDEDGEEIRIKAYDEDEEDEDPIEGQGFAAQPVEIVREEIVTVTKNPDTEEKISVMDNTHGNDNNDNIYDLVKAQSVQLNKLTDIVESLQSQIKQLGETRPSSRKTTTTRNLIKSMKNKVVAKKVKGRSSKNKKK